MHKKNVITYLIIFNLLAILVILLGKISVLRNFINVIFVSSYYTNNIW